MTFDEVTREAAKEAERAVALTMKNLKHKYTNTCTTKMTSRNF
jgi:NADH pyrophosphatase NudC (nudix superfamily)